MSDDRLTGQRSQVLSPADRQPSDSASLVDGSESVKVEFGESERHQRQILPEPPVDDLPPPEHSSASSPRSPSESDETAFEVIIPDLDGARHQMPAHPAQHRFESLVARSLDRHEPGMPARLGVRRVLFRALKSARIRQFFSRDSA